jgi:mannosyltransferase OCH1-like enzyme
MDNYPDKDWAQIYKFADSRVTQADIWRLLCLYEHGGVYADIDTVCINPICSFIDMQADFVIESGISNDRSNSRTVIASDGSLMEITNSVFATQPRGHFISLLVQQVKEKCLNEIYSGNLNIHVDITGPSIYAHTYMSYKNSVDYVKLFDQSKIIELSGSKTWNDFQQTNMPFRFSRLNSVYADISLDTQNEIKFFHNSGHGGFVYKL